MKALQQRPDYKSKTANKFRCGVGPAMAGNADKSIETPGNGMF